MTCMGSAPAVQRNQLGKCGPITMRLAIADGRLGELPACESPSGPPRANHYDYTAALSAENEPPAIQQPWEGRDPGALRPGWPAFWVCNTRKLPAQCRWIDPDCARIGVANLGLRRDQAARPGSSGSRPVPGRGHSQRRNPLPFASTGHAPRREPPLLDRVHSGPCRSQILLVVPLD